MAECLGYELPPRLQLSVARYEHSLVKLKQADLQEKLFLATYRIELEQAKRIRDKLRSALRLWQSKDHQIADEGGDGISNNVDQDDEAVMAINGGDHSDYMEESKESDIGELSSTVEEPCNIPRTDGIERLEERQLAFMEQQEKIYKQLTECQQNIKLLISKADSMKKTKVSRVWNDDIPLKSMGTQSNFSLQRTPFLQKTSQHSDLSIFASGNANTDLQDNENDCAMPKDDHSAPSEVLSPVLSVNASLTYSEFGSGGVCKTACIDTSRSENRQEPTNSKKSILVVTATQTEIGDEDSTSKIPRQSECASSLMSIRNETNKTHENPGYDDMTEIDTSSDDKSVLSCNNYGSHKGTRKDSPTESDGFTARKLDFDSKCIEKPKTKRKRRQRICYRSPKRKKYYNQLRACVQPQELTAVSFTYNKIPFTKRQLTETFDGDTHTIRKKMEFTASDIIVHSDVIPDDLLNTPKVTKKTKRKCVNSTTKTTDTQTKGGKPYVLKQQQLSAKGVTHAAESRNDKNAENCGFLSKEKESPSSDDKKPRKEKEKLKPSNVEAPPVKRRGRPKRKCTTSVETTKSLRTNKSETERKSLQTSCDKTGESIGTKSAKRKNVKSYRGGSDAPVDEKQESVDTLRADVQSNGRNLRGTRRTRNKVQEAVDEKTPPLSKSKIGTESKEKSIRRGARKTKTDNSKAIISKTEESGGRNLRSRTRKNDNKPKDSEAVQSKAKEPTKEPVDLTRNNNTVFASNFRSSLCGLRLVPLTLGNITEEDVELTTEVSKLTATVSKECKEEASENNNTKLKPSQDLSHSNDKNEDKLNNFNKLYLKFEVSETTSVVHSAERFPNHGLVNMISKDDCEKEDTVVDKGINLSATKDSHCLADLRNLASSSNVNHTNHGERNIETVVDGEKFSSPSKSPSENKLKVPVNKGERASKSKYCSQEPAKKKCSSRNGVKEKSSPFHLQSGARRSASKTSASRKSAGCIKMIPNEVTVSRDSKFKGSQASFSSTPSTHHSGKKSVLSSSTNPAHSPASTKHRPELGKVVQINATMSSDTAKVPGLRSSSRLRGKSYNFDESSSARGATKSKTSLIPDKSGVKNSGNRLTGKKIEQTKAKRKVETRNEEISNNTASVKKIKDSTTIDEKRRLRKRSLNEIGPPSKTTTATDEKCGGDAQESIAEVGICDKSQNKRQRRGKGNSIAKSKLTDVDETELIEREGSENDGHRVNDANRSLITRTAGTRQRKGKSIRDTKSVVKEKAKSDQDSHSGNGIDNDKDSHVLNEKKRSVQTNKQKVQKAPLKGKARKGGAKTTPTTANCSVLKLQKEEDDIRSGTDNDTHLPVSSISIGDKAGGTKDGMKEVDNLESKEQSANASSGKSGSFIHAKDENILTSVSATKNKLYDGNDEASVVQERTETISTPALPTESNETSPSSASNSCRKYEHTTTDGLSGTNSQCLVQEETKAGPIAQGHVNESVANKERSSREVCSGVKASKTDAAGLRRSTRKRQKENRLAMESSQQDTGNENSTFAMKKRKTLFNSKENSLMTSGFLGLQDTMNGTVGLSNRTNISSMPPTLAKFLKSFVAPKLKQQSGRTSSTGSTNKSQGSRQ